MRNEPSTKMLIAMKNEILLRIQKNFPLVAKPFDAIAQELGITQEDVLDILQKEKNNNIIRQTSAIFDTKKLGYTSSLVAFNLDEQRIEDAVELLNAHPGISHNYERNHDFNIWFTLAVAPDSKLGLEKTIEILAHKCKANEYIMLPTLKLFKIAVKLDTTNNEKKKEKVKKKTFTQLTLTQEYYTLIQLLQKDLKFVSEPFKYIIDAMEISYEKLFGMMDELISSGHMRRYASILNHRKAGFNANAMVVWDIKEEDAMDIGEKAASFSAVSHCYLRPKYKNWPFNLFSMIHGKTKEDTQQVIDSIKEEIECKEYMPLYSSREFKKTRIQYFSDEFNAWEAQHIKGIQ
jgi:DNA-binding Lrp family transcriptional regulator